MKHRRGFNSLQIALHWAVALGVVFNYFVSSGMGKALHQRLEGTPVTVSIAQLHVFIGMTVLVLAVIRLIVRLTRGAPPPEAGLMGKIGEWTHWALYALLLLAPIAGGMAWLGGVEAAGDVHALLANLLFFLACFHAAAALYHHMS
ncbi:MAG: cytochrome b [Paracoccus sp. (in: a-proteobacteria)]